MSEPLFVNCKRCLEQKPANKSAREYARLNVCIDGNFLRITCVRHDAEVVTIDLRGPARTPGGLQLPTECAECAAGDTNHVH